MCVYIVYIYTYTYIYIYIYIYSLQSWNNTRYAICWDTFSAFLHQQKFTKLYWTFNCNAIYQKFDLYYLCLFRLFSGLQIVQFWSVNHASYFILDLWPMLILEIFSSLDIKRGQFQFLVTFLAVFFLVCKLYIRSVNQFCISSYILNMGGILCEGF